MMKGFKRPEDNFKILSKNGEVMLDSSSFFCFSNVTLELCSLKSIKQNSTTLASPSTVDRKP
jgi:hypothetical protein